MVGQVATGQRAKSAAGHRRRTSALERAAPLLLVLLILVEGGLAVEHEAKRFWRPPETHHNTYTAVVTLARLIEGWTPTDPTCTAYACPGGFEQPPTVPDQRTLRDRLAWIWTYGGRYANAYPLWAAPAALATIAFPGSLVAPAMGLRFWFGFLLVAAYALGKVARGPVTGLAAAALCCGMPGLFGFGMLHQDSIPLAAIATALGAAVLASAGFSRLRYCALAGGLAALAWRTPENISGAILVGMAAFAPVLLTGVTAVANLLAGGGRPLRRLVGLTLAVGPMLWLTYITWRWNQEAVEYITNTTRGDAPNDWIRDAAVLPWPVFGYVEELTRDLVRLPLIAFITAGLCLLPRAPRGHRLAVLGMFVVPLAFLSSSTGKGLWYIIPSLPALGVAGALGLGAVANASLRVGLFTAAVFFSFYARIGALIAPDATWNALEEARPPDSAFRHFVHFVRPRNVLDGLPPLAAFAAHENVGRASADLARFARERAAEGAPTRVIVLSTYIHRADAACWIVQVGAPEATCFSPMWGHTEQVSERVLDPARYDVLAWVERDGLRALSLTPDQPLAPELVKSLGEHPESWRPRTEALLHGINALTWEPVELPSGTVYVRNR